MRLLKALIDPMVFLILGGLGGTIVGLLLMRAILLGQTPLSSSDNADGLAAVARILLVFGLPLFGLVVGLVLGWCAGALMYAVRMMPDEDSTSKRDV